MHWYLILTPHFIKWSVFNRQWIRAKGGIRAIRVQRNKVKCLFLYCLLQSTCSLPVGLSQILSGLLLRNYWCHFIQTSQEWSEPSLVVQTVSIFKFSDFCQSYGPLIIFIFKDCPDYPSKILVQFQWKFTGLISSSSPCAFLTVFLIE